MWRSESTHDSTCCAMTSHLDFASRQRVVLRDAERRGVTGAQGLSIGFRHGLLGTGRRMRVGLGVSKHRPWRRLDWLVHA